MNRHMFLSILFVCSVVFVYYATSTSLAHDLTQPCTDLLENKFEQEKPKEIDYGLEDSDMYSDEDFRCDC